MGHIEAVKIFSSIAQPIIFLQALKVYYSDCSKTALHMTTKVQEIQEKLEKP